MQIKDISESVVIIVPMFLLVVTVVAVVAWIAMGAKGGKGARFAAWLVLVALSLWCGGGIAFVALTLVYLTLGSQVTIAAAAVALVLLVAMPFFWWYVVRNRGRDDAGTPQAH
jgi:hypothetical protein